MLGYSRSMLKRACLLLLSIPLVAGATGAQSTQPPLLPPRPPVTIPAPDPALVAALDATSRGGLDDLVLAGFSGQPLAGWLEYAALRTRFDSLPPARGAAFLAAHKGEPVAAAFRADWLPALARRNEWPAFLDAWDPAIDAPTLRCLRLQALMAMDRVDAAWTAEAQALWRSSGASLPAQCDAPFALLAAQGGLPDALRWERFDKAVEAAQSAVMRSIARGFSNPGDAAQAQAWAAYLDTPGGDVSAWPKSARSRLVAAAALAKLARSNPDRAEALLPGVAQVLGFGEAELGRVRYQIALWTVASYLPDAARRLAAVPESAYDDSLREWRVREALARADWPAALDAIARMPQAQRNDSRWLYFAARLRELIGDPAGARALYAQAAQKADFHGFLAADRLDQPYALCPRTLQAPVSAKQAVARDPGLVRALQLFQLDRRGWAAREWNAALAHFDPIQRQLAVEVAQDNGWFDRGVFGLVSVGGKRYPDEQQLYLLRFPLHHAEGIRREAARNRLDPAWIAAEIRAESVFDPRARSRADARGLMQVVPATGATLAKSLTMPWNGGDDLYDPDTNIALGSAYLRQLLDRYDGQAYLTIAAYNAGPAPLARWRAQRPALDPDVWIETIPYRETRDYVMRVLAFSVLYDWRLRGDALRLSDRLLGRSDGPRKGFICPAPATPAAAPAQDARKRP
ncbi:MAG: lytic transglycosylase domain-containing protein [Xanthomonadales bacterium]|nr:lytic transglycosylase domain-containing protein [Xanthomonadales bacterium]MBN8794677.1 lytic transglycosylase domain-containing protein [Stenotrophomonas nitritireducens]